MTTRDLIMAAAGASAPAVVTDPNFNRTTLLLPGDGTNGKQNQTFLDSSSNNFTITRNGNTTQGTFSPFSQTGWSNYFGATTSYAGVSNATLALGSGDFEITLYSYRLVAGQYLVGSGNTTGSWAIFGASGNTISLRINTLASDLLTGTAPLNQWNKIQVIRSSGTISLYVNDVLQSSTPNTTNFTTSNIGIGSYTQANNFAAAGYISNFKLVKAGTTILDTCRDNRFIDNSSTAFAITVTGTPSVQAFSPFAPTAAYSAATNGGSGYFDGTGDSLGTTATITNFYTATGDWEIETWVYPLSFNGPQYSCPIINFGNGSTDDLLLRASPTTGNATVIGLYVIDSAGGTPLGSSGTNSASNVLLLNQWSHIVVNRIAGVFNVWVNGTRVINFTTATSSQIRTTGNNTLNVGRAYAGTNPFWNGYIGGIKVRNGSTSYSGAAITVPTTPITAASSAFCCLFTNAGITDATGKNVLETVGNAQISTTQSKFGGSSMYFDGTGDAVLITGPTPPIGTLGDFTAEAWIYTGSSSDQTVFYLNGGTNLYAGCRVGINTNKIYLLVSTSGSAWAINSGNLGTISSNTWYFVQVTRSGGTFTLYVDGSSVYSSTAVSATTALMSGTLNYIGAANSSGVTNSFNGYIDDPRVSRYVRASTVPTTSFPLQ